MSLIDYSNGMPGVNVFPGGTTSGAGMWGGDDGYSGKLKMYYSRDDYSRDNYSGARMRNPSTGRYMSRDNMADRHYSGHNDIDLIKDLEMKLDYAQSERERQAIIDTINIIKNKG